MSATARTWFITGCSRGLGRALAEEVLRRGERAAVTARRVEDIRQLVERFPGRAHAARLDVTRPDEIRSVVDSALAAFGRIDVLVNNAGYGLMGAIEEVEDEEIRRQMETNFFGPLDVIRAVLPQLRRQRSGHILNISSHAGFVGFPGFGIYSASKFALEGLSEALARELAPLGIYVTIVELGPFRTDWVGPSLVRTARLIDDYAESSGRIREFVTGFYGKQPGNPAAAAKAMVDVIEAPNPPRRLVLGAAAVSEIRAKLQSVAKDLDEWEQTALAADFRQDTPDSDAGAYAQVEEVLR